MPDSSQNSELVRHLDVLVPGRLPEAVFEAVARFVVTPTFVLVPLFRCHDSTRVILTRRDAGDSQYAGMLHPPGKILLATDKDLEAVFARLVSTELRGLHIGSAPVFVTHFFDEITRGHEISMVHYLEVDDPNEKVQSYDPFALPKDVIQTDIPRIIAAVEAFDQMSCQRRGKATV
ncbi:hypothetical protein N9M66_00465 [Litoreibacter sp.]|nr:hypothetical protein [Litoreibacter sp.]